MVSIVRLQSLVKFATSSNPTYDSVPTAYWSVLEAFVGIFCICMPALRRFLARIFPTCFASTQSDSRYRHYDDAENDDAGAQTPNKLSDCRKKGSSGKPSLNSWKKFGVSGLDTGITKTMETRVESRNDGGEEDDEVMLVDVDSGRRKEGEREG